MCFPLTLIDKRSQRCLSLFFLMGSTKKVWYIYVRQNNACFKEFVPKSIIQNTELWAVLPIQYERIECLRCVIQKLIPLPSEGTSQSKYKPKGVNSGFSFITSMLVSQDWPQHKGRHRSIPRLLTLCLSMSLWGGMWEVIWGQLVFMWTVIWYLHAKE